VTWDLFQGKKKVLSISYDTTVTISTKLVQTHPHSAILVVKLGVAAEGWRYQSQNADLPAKTDHVTPVVSDSIA